MKTQVRLVFTAIFFFVLCASVLAQPAAPVNSDVYSQLKFRYIGPVGNRADAVAGVPGNPNIYYVGAASGGIFKTTDGGIHWDPIFDSEPVSSIAAYSTISRRYRRFCFVPAIFAKDLRARIVRPCLPIILPMSSGATRTSISVAPLRCSTSRTSTVSLSSTSDLTIISIASRMASVQ